MVDVSAHIDGGVLLFRVSCGPQHIVFSDPRLRVDTGYMQTIELRLSIEVSIHNIFYSETSCENKNMFLKISM